MISIRVLEQLAPLTRNLHTNTGRHWFKACIMAHLSKYLTINLFLQLFESTGQFFWFLNGKTKRGWTNVLLWSKLHSNYIRHLTSFAFPRTFPYPKMLIESFSGAICPQTQILIIQPLYMPKKSMNFSLIYCQFFLSFLHSWINKNFPDIIIQP